MNKLSTIFCAIIIIGFFHNAYPADYIIIECPIMGFHETDSTSEFNEYVLDSAAKMLDRETGDILDYPPEIQYLGYFSDLPNLKLFYTNLRPYLTDSDESPYRRFLFNTSDSSIYHFGGDTYRYFQVIKKYLRPDITDKKIENVLNLYLNTLSVDDAYYILDSTSYVYNVLHYWWGEPVDSLEYPNSKRMNDIKWISENIKPISIEQNGQQFYAKVFSWDDDYGRVEFWNFVISHDFLQIIDRHTIIEGFGYHNALH